MHSVSCGPPDFFIQCYSPGQYQVAYGVAPLLRRGITGKGETVMMPELAHKPGPSFTDIRKALLDLPGAQTGDAFASAVILVGAPDRMAVYDYHAHLGLWRVGLRLHAGPGLYHRYMGLIEQCRTELLAHGHGQWTGRDVDLALLTHGQHRGLPRPKPWRQR